MNIDDIANASLAKVKLGVDANIDYPLVAAYLLAQQLQKKKRLCQIV